MRARRPADLGFWVLKPAAGEKPPHLPRRLIGRDFVVATDHEAFRGISGERLVCFFAFSPPSGFGLANSAVIKSMAARARAFVAD